MRNNAVEISNLTVNPNGFRLYVNHLEVPKGFVTGIIGRNGAGKTTFLKSILELMRKENGIVTLLGMSMKEDGMKIKDSIGYVSDNYMYPLNYSAKDIGKRLGIFYSRFDENYYLKMLKRLDVDASKKGHQSSEGTKAKISLAFALAIKPELLILDEPTAHLDPVARRQVLDLLYEIMQEEENTILFSTHITEDLDRIADYIVHIEDGKITFNMSKEELMEEYQRVTFNMDKAHSSISSSLKGVVKENGTITALCTNSSAFKSNPDYSFTALTLEDIMIELNREYEKKHR